MQEKIRNLQEKLERLHPEVEKMLESPNVAADLRREFKGKTKQYLDMFESLQQMKELTTSKETVDGLDRQQLEILTIWENFEENMRKRIMEP